ncbi:TPA: hypothetical protein U2L42_001922 [Citrobacter amalonaticus]|nr:hypothetical protein [Citrobacter amalonaticus]HEM7845131.1 hypothetical protein [Citrobacter amalonaticus]HEM7920340.1 hypothetical protein [Citrobacter amalonaticus]
MTTTSFTKEQLISRAREKVKSLEFAVTQTAFTDNRAELEEELELARIALASQEAVPVAWLWTHPECENDVSLTTPNNDEDAEDAMACGWSAQPLYTAPPAPVVPDEKTDSDYVTDCHGVPSLEDCAHQRGWNACRAAMLQGKAEQPQNAQQNIPGNIPDGYALVPIDATRAMIDAAARVEEDGYDAMHKAMIAAAPQQEVK